MSSENRINLVNMNSSDAQDTTGYYLWIDSRKFCQNQWKSVLNWIGEDEITIYLWIPVFLTSVPYWICNLPLLAMDMTGKPSFLYQYKIQEGQHKISWSQLKIIFPVVLLNQLITIIPLYGFYLICLWKGSISYQPGLPTLFCAIMEFSSFVAVEEILFYYVHRFLHVPEVYKRIHKMHHQWKAPCSMSTFYCHPVEHIISTVIPGLIGPIIFGSHILVAYIWFTVSVLNAVNAHSGYHLPVFQSSEAHDYHHLKFNEMFGVLGILDRLHNTDTKFRLSIQCKRNQTFFSFTPIRKLIPDFDCKKPKTEKQE
ncbi:fatty acid hydroxylase domain-containing protein 2-like [Styela clava]